MKKYVLALFVFSSFLCFAQEETATLTKPKVFDLKPHPLEKVIRHLSEKDLFPAVPCPIVAQEPPPKEVLDNLSPETDPLTNPRCQKPAKCAADPLPTTDPKRTMFDKFIIEAANLYGINPALIKAQVHTETGFHPLLENQPEKTAYEAGGGHRSYKWGKGLGQFGADNAGNYGLDWNAPKPDSSVDLTDPNAPINQPDRYGTFSIWSPRGAILAKAQMLKNFYDRKDEVALLDSNGQETGKTVRIDVVYKRNEVETARYLAGMYNRGARPIDSIKEYYRQHKSFPRYYVEAWDVERVADTPKKALLLKGQKINLCHVYKIAGLCGEKAEGFFGEYSKDYERGSDGNWKVLS